MMGAQQVLLRKENEELKTKVHRTKDNQFIQISVRNARTHLDDGKAQFTDFEIELKTNHIAFTLKSSKVRRRYSDFVWLRNRLTKDTMTPDQPPSLPGRRLFGRFNKDFIKQRQKKLQEFLFGLVQNNVYLSHAALHLFLQSKLSVDDIDCYLDKNQDEDASETILAESEVEARLKGLVNRERLGSKHDSGISGDYDDPDMLLGSNDFLNETTLPSSYQENNNDMTDLKQEDDIFSDGNTADIESEVDMNDKDSSEHSDDEELAAELDKLRMTLPAPLPNNSDDDRFDSSIEYSDNPITTDSDTNLDKESDSPYYQTSSINCLTSSRVSSQENVRSTPTKRSKRRFSKSHSFRKLSHSNASLPEFHVQSNTEINATFDKESPLRRSKSFYEYQTRRNSNRRKSEVLLKQSSFGSDVCKTPRRKNSVGTPRKLRRNPSFLSSTERTPVKRKISLNEYIIVGRETFAEMSLPLAQKEEANLNSL